MELIMKYMPYIEVVAQVVLALIIMASALVRVFAKDKMEDVGEIAEKALKILSYFPTLGINPRTKMLEEQLKEMQQREEKKKAA